MIYPVPGFPIYESQIVANGAVPVPIFLREARDFAFDPAELEAKITPKTRLLILNSPQNPTGGVLSGADLDAIAEHPAAVIRRSGCSPTKSTRGSSTTAASIRSRRRAGMLERTVICDGASKTWAMTGWRLGYVANRALAPVFTRWITNTESCASQISQWAASRRSTARRIPLRTCMRRFRERRDLIVRLLNDVPGITLQDVPAARSMRGPT